METLQCLQCVLMLFLGLSATDREGAKQRDPGSALKRVLRFNKALPLTKEPGYDYITAAAAAAAPVFGTGTGIDAGNGDSAREEAEDVWRLSQPSTHRNPNLLGNTGSPAARPWQIRSASLRTPQQKSDWASTRKKRPKKAILCPPHSHYSPCTSGCPASCRDPTAPDSCKERPCVKGCACESGFLLQDGGSGSGSGGTCVSRQQCGCWHQGRSYPVGSGFWTDSSCTTKCTCPSPGGTVRCSADSCPKDSDCGVENGIPGCHRHVAYGICRIHGDPHYTTFDQEMHHFLGNCTYTLATTLCAPRLTKLPHFSVEAKNEYLENPSRSFVDKVLVGLHGHQVEIHKGNQRQVLVDQIWRTLPVKTENGSVTVSKSGRYISVEADFQLIVNYDADHSLEIRMPITFFNSTCGLCGNFNNLKEDDSMMPNGQQAPNSTELGKSWQVPDAKYDHPHCGVPNITPPCTTEEEDTYKADEFCGILTNSQGPFRACHATIGAEAFFDTCVQDMCTFTGKQNLLCNTLGAYGDACQRAGVGLGNWRIDTFCLFLCPSNSEHNMCTSACPATCANPLAPQNCSKPCVEGCECNGGFAFSGGECVSVADCGCLDEGKYYEKGESFWKPDCSNQCHCEENGTLVCSTETCKEEQICKVQNGILGCYMPATATCHIFGGSHYITFDGRLHHFQGGCNYTAVESYNHPSEQLSVTIRNERQEHQARTSLHSVSLSFKGLQIVLRKDKVVWVNGAPVVLPATLGQGVLLKAKPPYVVISSPFGLQLEFDGGQQLFVEVSEKYKGRLRGLCGTYSSDKAEGVVEDSAATLASSWMVMDTDWKCDPVVPAPPACSPALKRQYNVLCSVVSDVEGPFQGCQGKISPLQYVTSCVHDQCAAAGRRSEHCQESLEAYAAACSRADLHLGDWWAGALCEPTSQCNFDCNFDDSLCLWTQATADDFDWVRHQGSTPSWMTGPSYDHTTGKGYYLYVEGDNVLEGNVARLLSPTCPSRGPHCFRFWYHMFGAASLMSLRVYVVPEGEEPQRLWIATGRKENRWLQAGVTVPNAGKLQIIVEGMRGEDFASDVAVDDVSISSGPCREAAPVQ